MASAVDQNPSEEESGVSDSELNSTEITFKLPYEEVPARGGGVFYQTPDDHLYRSFNAASHWQLVVNNTTLNKKTMKIRMKNMLMNLRNKYHRVQSAVSAWSIHVTLH